MSQLPFISLDGLDGTGKTTQCRLLAEWLRARGLPVIDCCDPGGTAIGEAIRDLLLGRRDDMVLPCEAFLFMASRAQLTAEIIRPALEAGRAVVADRYLLANVVYQGHAGGMNPEQLWEIGRLATEGLQPDLTFVLDLPVEAALARRRGPGDRVENRDGSYHTRVREGFLAEARRQPDKIRVVDAILPIEKVHARICQMVSEFFPKEMLSRGS
jgi:dTMP kinase